MILALKEQDKLGHMRHEESLIHITWKISGHCIYQHELTEIAKHLKYNNEHSHVLFVDMRLMMSFACDAYVLGSSKVEVVEKEP